MAGIDESGSDMSPKAAMTAVRSSYLTPPTDYRNAEFEAHLGRHEGQGINGKGEKSWYIGISALEEYWTEAAIMGVLYNHNPIISESPSTIGASFLRVWSILIYIGRPELITDFIQEPWDDDNLPMKPDGGPSVSHRGVAFTRAMEDFREQQWPFTPVRFLKGKHRMDRRPLDPRVMWPVTYEEVLTDPNLFSPRTVVTRVRLHDDCTDFEEKIVVFKQYQSSDGCAAWEREVKTFHIAGDSPDIVQYLGSFEQNDKFVIILEHANGGSLLDVFKKNQQPRNFSQISKFWDSLMHVLFGLYHLHHVNFGGGYIGCAHRDIKPSNILVFRKEGADYFDFKLKLTDFDTSSGMQRITDADMGTQDNDGSRTYCSPEASRFYEEAEHSTLTVPLDSDVWSFGCVVSESLAWIAGGEEGRLDYEKRRKAATSQVAGILNSGYEACFHDGTVVLPCVTAVHQEAMGALRGFDTYSPVIKSIAETMMLQPSGSGRLASLPVYHQFQNAIQRMLSPGGPQPATSDQATAHTWPATPAFDAAATNLAGRLGVVTPLPPPTAVDARPPELMLMTPPPSRSREPGISRFDNHPSNQLSPVMNLDPTRAGLLPNGLPSPLGTVMNIVHVGSPAHPRADSSSRRPSSYPGPADQYASLDERTQALDIGTGMAGGGSADLIRRLSRGSTRREQVTSEPGVNGRPSDAKHEWPAPGGHSDWRGSAAASCLPSNTHCSRPKAPAEKQPEPYPRVTVEEVLSWKEGGCIYPLPGRQQVLPDLEGREQVFVIDDSRTMRQNHRLQVIETAKALMYLVKDCDPNGIEMRFTSNPSKPYKGSRMLWFKTEKTAPLIDRIRKHFDECRTDTCNMEQKLNEVAKAVLRGTCPISITVLTDGIWEIGSKAPGGGVENTICSLVDDMRRQLGAKRTDVAVQFVQFGNHPVATARLEYLDDKLKKMPNMMDIVDHRHHTDSVWLMLMGAISEAGDNYKSSLRAPDVEQSQRRHSTSGR